MALNMDYSASEIEALKRDLEMAALFGKSLLEEKNELQMKLENAMKDNDAKIESYEQGKHSLTMQLQIKENMVQSLQEELESQERKQISEIQKVTKNLEDQLSVLNKKNFASDAIIETLENELTISKEQVRAMKELLEESKQHRELSFIASHDLSLDETHSIQNEMLALLNEKQDLVTQNMEIKAALKKSDCQITNLKKSLQYHEKEIEEKECKLTTMYNTLEKNKETIMELEMEIENMKMECTDPNKKGNSLFAEVEDNRKVLENIVITLKANYTTLKEQYELKVQHVSKLKMQIASLIDIGSSKADSDYQKSLEDSIAVTKGQLDEFSKRCEELELELQEMKNCNEIKCEQESQLEVSNMGIGNFFKTLYEETQKKLNTAQAELTAVRFKNVSLNDKLIQLQRKLHRLEREKHSMYSELIKLRVKLEEMTIDKGDIIVNKEPVVVRVKEKLQFSKPKINEEINIISTEDEKVKFPLNQSLRCHKLVNNLEAKYQLVNNESVIRNVTQKLPFDEPKVMEENSKCPLKENLICPKLNPDFVDKHCEENLNVVTEENKENIKICPTKVKKSFKIADTVTVQDSTGQINNIDLKQDGLGMKPKPIRRKMVASKVIVATDNQETQCSQQ